MPKRKFRATQPRRTLVRGSSIRRASPRRTSTVRRSSTMRRRR